MRPTHIEVNRIEHLVTITWTDGHESRYPFGGLRAVCPCVSCKGGHAQMGLPPDPVVVRDTEAGELTVEDVQAVGSYALQFQWSDGHSTGIYTWEYLRQACPCSLCLSTK